MEKRRPLLITGAGSGIGLATALAAARRAWSVHATVHSQESLATVKAAAQAEGLDIAVSVLDVTDAKGCEEVIDSVRPQVLINNAGLGSAGAIEETEISTGRNQLEIMAVAPMRLSQLAVPHMRAAGGGHIINISSLGGRTSAPLTGWYVASKHALEGLTDALRMEVASDSIAVSLIEPGGVNTGILKKAIETTPVSSRSKYARGYERAERLTAFCQRFQGSPDRVADVVIKALESSWPRARYVVGTDARLMLLAGKVFPTRLRDRVKRKMLAL